MERSDDQRKVKVVSGRLNWTGWPRCGQVFRVETHAGSMSYVGTGDDQGIDSWTNKPRSSARILRALNLNPKGDGPSYMSELRVLKTI